MGCLESEKIIVVTKVNKIKMDCCIGVLLARDFQLRIIIINLSKEETSNRK
jgi:hypothetical protein